MELIISLRHQQVHFTGSVKWAFKETIIYQEFSAGKYQLNWTAAAGTPWSGIPVRDRRHSGCIDHKLLERTLPL